ncbi:uncharacterized protein LOC111453420 [Cucurbita moschata]|uniref:Uncharacterized protein LOC111453420 n=1 Tax=Cucurbita moschata TaxID=3662 RepID=A0A6J1GEE2_CUCMO|nr:uncharacterized protein LOC111453420 [Cucurbita moschata]
MEIFNPKTRSRLLLLFFILMLHVASCFAEPNKAPERPSFGNFIQETVAILKKSHPSPWDKVKCLIHQMQLQFFPPNLDFRSSDEAKGVVDEVKEAVEKSFGASKDAVSESARSAAKVMEEAVDKVKENLVDKDKDKDKDKHSHDEL